MKHLTTVPFLIAALLLSIVPASATTPIFHGIATQNRASVCNLSLDYGAYGDDTHDDTTALENAITDNQAGKCGTIVLDAGKTYLINGAIEIPYTMSGNYPYQKYLRITSDGPQVNGYATAVYANGSGALDMRYNGQDGQHPAKIDTRGAGELEIDHITLEDKGTDDFIFLQTTNTTLNVHDNMIIGDTTEGNTSNKQDAFRLGGTGYWATGVSTTNGSTTLTSVGGDAFSSNMVGWTIVYGTANLSTRFTTTIASYVSPTQVTLNAAATQTISGGTSNTFAVGSDAKAPFYGYLSTFARNTYSYIRRAMIWENYANTVAVRDDYVYYTSGCSQSDIPNCAPYYFDKTGSPVTSNFLEDLGIETTHYPYAVSFMGFDNANVITGGYVGDPTSTNFGAVYYGNGNFQNTVRMGYYGAQGGNPSINTTIATGFSSGVQTVTPASMTGITTSTPLLIDPDGSGVQEWVTPSATTGTTFTATFAYAHGNNIRVMGAAPFTAGAYASSNTLISNGVAGNSTHLASGVDGLTLNGNGAAITANDGTNPTNTVISTKNGALFLSSYLSGTSVYLYNANRNQYNDQWDDSGNEYPHGTVYAGGSVQYKTAVSTCSSSGYLPCKFTWSCTMAAGSCTATQSVLAVASCTVEFTVSPVLSTTNLASVWPTQSSTTLTVNVHDMLGTSTAAMSGAGQCI